LAAVAVASVGAVHLEDGSKGRTKNKSWIIDIH
jgi:hypothetical protein